MHEGFPLAARWRDAQHDALPVHSRREGICGEYIEPSVIQNRTSMLNASLQLYSRSIMVLAMLGIVYLAEFCLMSYTMTVVFPAPSPAPGIAVPCVAIGPKTWLITFWVRHKSISTYLVLNEWVTGNPPGIRYIDIHLNSLQVF